MSGIGLGFGWIAVIIVTALLSGAANLWVRKAYSKYSEKTSYSGMTGAQVARSILDRNGLNDIRVEPVAGTLTDHYDPRSKVVRLSEGNFKESSIAGMSVAAHETGHAIQDSRGYLPMRLRSGIVPVVNLGSQAFMPLFLIGIFVGAPLFIQLAAVALAGVLLFHVVTLPVEFNASTRAYGQLTKYGMLSRDEAGGTKRVLTAAAFTYIAAALTTLLMLVWVLLMGQGE